MKPTIALLALLIVGCRGGESSVGPTTPTTPTSPAGPPTQVDGGQLFTYGNAVAYLQAGIGEYKAAITPGASLRAITVADGWLGDRSSGAISTYACFSTNRSSASWLPSKETALDWQRMAGGTIVAGAC